MKLRLGIQKLIITLLLALMAVASIHAQSRRGCTVKIFTKGSKKDLPVIRSFIMKADLLVSRILPLKSFAILDYSAVLMAKDELREAGVISQGKKGLRFYLSEDISSWQNNDKNLSNIIASIILKSSGTSNGENTSVIPKWMTYAILRKIERRQSKITIPGTVAFPGVHALVLSGAKIDWITMVSTLSPPEEPNAKAIYKETSEIMLDAILRLPEGKEAILNIVELANKGINQKDLLQTVLAKKISDLASHMRFSNLKIHSSDALEQWFTYNLRVASVNSFTPCTPTGAEKLFREAEVVSYRAKVNDNEDSPIEERFCKIDELPEKLDEIINLQGVVIKKQRDLAIIAFSIPITLQNYMYKMQKSMDLLLTAKDNDKLKQAFREKYLHEKQGFYDELEKQNKVEVYLSKIELEFVPPSYRYYAEINAMKEIRERSRERWPALTELLDKNDTWKIEKEDQ